MNGGRSIATLHQRKGRSTTYILFPILRDTQTDPLTTNLTGKSVANPQEIPSLQQIGGCFRKISMPAFFFLKFFLVFCPFFFVDLIQIHLS